ncbi:unnamed protein product [Brachionus calyciflorus]|uniref:Tetratricopeptide repeat protein 21A/21B C-terminal ARM domain-containing protein n=1 Tax=Brachionus calyciflorus TaxID=104777 RepID=A0A813VZD5_9BILA|nr:unnamed protein product [Brachionus calyciflorus]
MSNKPEVKQSQDKVPKLPSLEGLNWLLHLYYVRKDFKACKDLIKEQMTLTNGMCEYALYVHALIMRQEGRIQESLELFQSCSVLNPANVLNLKQVARSLFLLGRHKAAIDVFNESLKTSPSDWEIKHNIGICYWHLKQNEKAKQYFKEAVNLSKNEVSFLMMAKIFIKENNIDAAIEILAKAAEYNPESSEILTILGLLFMKQRQFQKSFEALGNALTYNPTHYKAILAVCNMIQIHNDHDVALNKYRIAADTAPESSRLWNNIGMCFFGKKKFVAAISCLKRATYLSPFEWKILYNLGLVHLAMQQYASAFRYLNSAVNFKPKEPTIYSLMAVALTYLDDAVNAKQAYEHSLSLDGENVYTNLNYAVFLYNQGDRQGAASKLIEFRKNFDSILQGKRRDIDPELQEISSKLGPILNIGEISRPKNKEVESNFQSNADVAQKYSNVSKPVDDSGENYRRESTVASVSNVGFNGPSRSESRASTANLMRRDFEN